MTAKASKTTVDPKVFTFESIMSKMKPPKPETVSVFVAAELAPRLQELKVLLDAADDDTAERGIGDADGYEEWLAEFNELAAEWNASEVQFVLRPTKRSDKTAARAAMVADGVSIDDDDAEDIASCYILGQVCTNTNMSGAEHLRFREEIGEVAWSPLLQAVYRVNMGAGVSVPFSQRPSRTPTSI